jgi:hypothetical protein
VDEAPLHGEPRAPHALRLHRNGRCGSGREIPAPPPSFLSLSAQRAREFFEIDPDVLAAIINDDRAFLEDFVPKQREAELLGRQESDGRILLPGDADWERYRQLVEVREALDGLGLIRLELEADFRIAIGPSDGFKGMASYESQSIARFDQDSLRSNEPNLYARYLVKEHRRPFRLR